MARKRTSSDLYSFTRQGSLKIDNTRATTIIILFYQFSLGLTATIMGACLYANVSTRSLSLLNLPFIVMGLLCLIISCLGCANLDATNGWDMPGKLALRVSLITYGILYLGLAALAAFAVAVSIKSGGHSLPGRSYQEYHLEDYSQWFKNRVMNHTRSSKWDYYKQQLVDSHVCSAFSGAFQLDTISEFYSEDLSAIEAGCCKPPDYCNFNYTSPTVWTKPQNQSFDSTSDCNLWDNDHSTRCFNCQSCKAGFLEEVKSKWLPMGIFILSYQFKQFLGFICIICYLLWK